MDKEEAERNHGLHKRHQNNPKLLKPKHHRVQICRYLKNPLIHDFRTPR